MTAEERRVLDVAVRRCTNPSWREIFSLHFRDDEEALRELACCQFTVTAIREEYRYFFVIARARSSIRGLRELYPAAFLLIDGEVYDHRNEDSEDGAPT